jgi:hypothetical protein
MPTSLHLRRADLLPHLQRLSEVQERAGLAPGATLGESMGVTPTMAGAGIQTTAPTMAPADQPTPIGGPERPTAQRGLVRTAGDGSGTAKPKTGADPGAAVTPYAGGEGARYTSPAAPAAPQGAYDPSVLSNNIQAPVAAGSPFFEEQRRRQGGPRYKPVEPEDIVNLAMQGRTGFKTEREQREFEEFVAEDPVENTPVTPGVSTEYEDRVSEFQIASPDSTGFNPWLEAAVERDPTVQNWTVGNRNQAYNDIQKVLTGEKPLRGRYAFDSTVLPDEFNISKPGNWSTSPDPNQREAFKSFAREQFAHKIADNPQYESVMNRVLQEQEQKLRTDMWEEWQEGAQKDIAEDFGRRELDLEFDKIRRVGEGGEAFFFDSTRIGEFQSPLTDEGATALGDALGAIFEVDTKYGTGRRWDSFTPEEQGELLRMGTELEQNLEAADLGGLLDMNPSLGQGEGLANYFSSTFGTGLFRTTDVHRDVSFGDDRLAETAFQYLRGATDEQLGLFAEALDDRSSVVREDNRARAVMDLFKQNAVADEESANFYRIQNLDTMMAESDRVEDVFQETIRQKQGEQGTLSGQRSAAQEAAMMAAFRANRKLFAGRLTVGDQSVQGSLESGNALLREYFEEERKTALRTSPFDAMAMMQMYGSAGRVGV